MAVIVNAYSDWKCTTPGIIYTPGSAAAFGGAANPNNYSGVELVAGMPKILWNQAANLPEGSSFTLSGGQMIYSWDVAQTIPTEENSNSDPINSQPGAGKIYNRFFTGNNGTYGFCISIIQNKYTSSECDVVVYKYRQTPADGNRTWWEYTSGEGGSISAYKDFYSSDGKKQIKIYKITLSEQTYYMFAFGVSADGQYDDIGTGVVGSSTLFMLIPIEFFDGKLPEPYVGPTSKESVESSFFPSTQYRDDISSRSNYNVNPYGVNSGSGIKLIFPNRLQDQSVYAGNLQQIINGIYRGSAQGFINMASQYIAEMTGGNTSRPQDEVSVILNGVLSCHSIPHIFPAGSSASYATNATQFQTICGYDVLLNQIDVTSPGQKTIFEQVYTSEKIEPRLNCFLDFEPYTHITLKLPFFPAISLQPSMVYDNFIRVTYKIDVLTGILSADVSILYYGEEIIISTMQQNVKTAIPIMGAGATDSALNKIASSTIAVLSSFGGASGGSAGGEMSSGFSMNLPQAAGAIYTGMDAISKAGTGVPVGKMSVDGLGVYLSPRSAYIIISHPEAAIPEAPDGSPSFLNNIGMAASLGGKVGDFSGGFASFSAVDLSGFSATDTEKAAIRSLLMEGVYL